MLELKDVCFAIQKDGEPLNLIDKVTLKVPRGHFMAIVGPSGCGKTTLLRIIAGFEQASCGRVLIDDKVVTQPSPDNVFVYQHNGLLPWMTVWQNVDLGVRNLDDQELRREKVQESIEMVELEGFENYYPNQLSGGMRRRAELARAMAINPNILILDEPFTGLDFLTHMKMREELVNMHEYFKQTMVMVTHDIDDAIIMADKIVIMTEVPSQISMMCGLDFQRPRNFDKDPALHELRDDIYFLLGVSYVA